MVKNHPLEQILAPKSIAIAGASNNMSKMGTMQFLNIIHCGFKGNIYPIHPKEKSIFGHPAYQNVHDLPSVPDLGILIVPTRLVSDLMKSFGEHGIKHALIITAGFKETGTDGKVLEETIQSIANTYDMRFLGPNCLGVINMHLPFNATVAPAPVKKGHFSLASQSGTYVAQSLLYLYKRGIALNKAISVGNEANIDLVDCLEYYLSDSTTKAIGLYIESIRRPREFLAIAREITKKKPIIAQYVGGTEAGARSCSSHTGAMAGPDYVYQGLFEQAGIIRVESIEDVYAFGHAMATQPPLKGKRIAILTNSGGPGTAMASTLDAHGLEVPTLSNNIHDKIKSYLPGHASAKNPVDLTFHTNMTLISQTLPNILLESDDIDGLLLHGIMDTGWAELFYPVYQKFTNDNLENLKTMFQSNMDAFIQLAQKHNKPIVINSFFEREDHAKSTLIDNGIPGTTSPEQAARIMAAMYAYHRINQRASDKVVKTSVSQVAKETIHSHSVLNEYQAKQLLREYGIPTCRENLVNNIDQALHTAREIGYPVVVKGCMADINHKTEHQLVHTNMQSEKQLIDAYATIHANYPTAQFLVCEQIQDQRELMAGMIRFGNFPPCITFGFGGIFAEVINDFSLRLAPLSYCDAIEMIDSIKSKNVLKTFRNTPDIDLNSLANILVQLGQMACHFDKIVEMDLNPIMINGNKPVVVDALIVLNDIADISYRKKGIIK